MGSTNTTTIFFILCAFLFPRPSFCGPLSFTPITPNFTASYLNFPDSFGAFLASPNNKFQARITNPRPGSQSYYFVVVHFASNTIVWSANRNAPITQSGKLILSARGLNLQDDTGQPIWSTPLSPSSSSVSSMQILESGNLLLLDSTNNTLWQSFDHPTDTIIAGQKLQIGSSLVASSSGDDLSAGGYKLVVGDHDATLQWNGNTYWKLSMETKAFWDTSSSVAYLLMNLTGVYLIGGNGGAVVIKIAMNGALNDSSNIYLAKLDPTGFFSVLKINSTGEPNPPDFRWPTDNCRIPSVCGKCSVCSNGGSCQCAPGFHSDPTNANRDCVPVDRALAMPGPCNVSSPSDTATIKYLNIREDLDYFSNDFINPVMNNVNLSACEGLCSRNCSCLGIFYSRNSSSCYVIRDYLGSFRIKSSSTIDSNRLGFIKTIVEGNPSDRSQDKKSDFPIVAVVLLPSSGVILIALVGSLICLRRRQMRRRWAKSPNFKSGLGYSSSSGEGDIGFVSIPGLPVRFDFKELALATEGFKSQIGSGGFGTVYKGTLSDGTDVAVKRITCMGSRGNTEFLTEIAVIGKIHHVNLVRLKGFCAHRGQRFLVYEFMSRGSLDRTLFNSEPVLGWRERYEIALGTARGLAYLHTGCEHKILHCDVKPENILLHGSQVKISDFGLSKLLSPEQSGLFTTMRGTRGYLAPEWLTSSSISDKTDVYSYGMVLLEIVRGRKNSSSQQMPSNNNNSSSATDSSSLSSAESVPAQQLVYFPLLALEMHEAGRYLELVDPRLAGKVRTEEAERLVRVALCCVQEEPNLRPSMSKVVGMLEGGMPVGEPVMESLNFLRFYGRRFTEASRGEGSEFVLSREPITNSTSLCNSISYMSSQQVSGPR